MATAKELLRVANLEVGVIESPSGSNNVKYNTWYYGKQVNGSQYPWCMVFVQWLFNYIQMAMPIRSGSCTAVMNAAQTEGRLVYTDYKPGDVVFMDFKGLKSPQHCGILEKYGRGIFYTIEGNTSTSSNDNGGAVMKRERSSKQVLCAYRAPFDPEVQILSPQDLVLKLTDKQAYELLKKAQRYSDTLPVPKWVYDQGYWEKLLKMGVVSTDTPETLIKRDELASILGKLGLIPDAE